jgi:GntR family transcriptional regulator
MVELARQGWVVRRRRLGTVVSGPSVEQPLDRLYSFMRSVGTARRTEVRFDGIRLAHDATAAAILVGDPHGTVMEVNRRYLVDGEPFAIERLWLPPEIGARLTEEALATEVVYDLLRERCGIAVTHGDESLRMTTLSRDDAAALGTRPGQPAFLVERTVYAGETPVEVRRTILRSDRARFRIRLPGIGLSAES